MTYSLGEVEAAARKAARGRGFDWGTAAEAGRAARWLEARGMDGCAALARYLDRDSLGAAPDWEDGPDGIRPRLEARGMDGRAAPARHLDRDSLGAAPDWEDGPDGIRPLCPLLAGLAVADAARTLTLPTRAAPMLSPLLFVPFGAMVAEVRNRTTRIEVSRASVVTDGRSAAFRGRDWPDGDGVLLRDAEGEDVEGVERLRAEPPEEAWRILERLGQRTHAPATDASRKLGAGADLSDND